MDAGDKIKITKGKFNFGGKISKQFDKHVKKSVPLSEHFLITLCKLEVHHQILFRLRLHRFYLSLSPLVT